MLTQTAEHRKAGDITGMKDSSRNWMSTNFYSEWEQVYKAYKCERDPERDPNDKSKIDETQTSIGMPDTWAITRRKVARLTAQIPNLRYRGDDKARAQNIGWKLMRDWDVGGVQRHQPRHLTQGLLFGWSVRPWSWDQIIYPRKKWVDPYSENEEDVGLVRDQYKEDLGKYAAENPDMDESGHMGLLLGEKGRPSEPPTLQVQYDWKKYEGPKTDFLFVGDCFPEPNFQTLQSSCWFIVQRWRDKSWIKRTAKRFPEFAAGFEELLQRYPKGNNRNQSGNTDQEFRRSLFGAIGKSFDDQTDNTEQGGYGGQWLITECHYPGANAKLAMVGEDAVWIGEMPYPYDLEGKIAFSELVLIDDLLTGIGDSDARIIRGLQKLHDRQTNVRWDLIYNVLRPFVTTTSQELYDNPDLIKRGKGFRLLPPVNGPGEYNIIGEQAAIASAAAGLQDDGHIQALIQMATGENNTSMMANADPQQGRTATGARLMAFNQDVLTKALNDAFTNTAIKADAEIMYLLNRSEMTKAERFDAAPYMRGQNAQEKMPEQNMIEVSLLDFQGDGEVVPEAGSTLADDDQGKVEKATYLYSLAAANPNLFNLEKARDEVLIAYGKGRELHEWAAPPPQPPPPPQPDPPKMSVSVKFEMLPPLVQEALMGAYVPALGGEQQGPPMDQQGPPPEDGSAAPQPPPPGMPAPPPPPNAGGIEMGPASRAARNINGG